MHCMYIKILIIIFIVCIILLCLKDASPKNDIFYNLDQFRKEYKSINSKFDNFMETLNKIYLKNELKNGDVEFSSKISYNNINSNRVVYFVPVNFFNKLLIDDIKQMDDVNEDVIDKIVNNINKIRYIDARVGIGYDDEENTKRIYFSYKQQKSIGLIGYNMNLYEFKEKKYKKMENKDIKEIIRNNFGDKLLNIFINIFPEYLWDTVGSKIEEKYMNVYIGLNYEYLLEQFCPDIKELLYYFYGFTNEYINEWIKKYKDKNILWISMGYDYKFRKSITFYFVYNKNIRTVYNKKSIKFLSKIFNYNFHL